MSAFGAMRTYAASLLGLLRPASRARNPCGCAGQPPPDDQPLAGANLTRHLKLTVSDSSGCTGTTWTLVPALAREASRCRPRAVSTGSSGFVGTIGGCRCRPPKAGGWKLASAAEKADGTGEGVQTAGE